MIVLSYHPLLRGPAGTVVSLSKEDVESGAVSEMDGFLASLPSGAAAGCLWADDGDGRPYPVLILGRGREIAEHFVEWSEGDPPAWFKLHVAERDGVYCLVLIPDVRKSMDRQLAAMALTSGRHVPVPEQTSVLFKPLRFVSNGPSGIWSKVRGAMSGKVKVGILDMSDVREGDAMSADPEKIVVLGEFEVAAGGPSEYVMSILSEQFEDAGA